MSDIHIKLAKIAGEIGSINKTERNKEQGFNFRSIEQITEKARPLLAKEGVSTAPRLISLDHSEVTAKSGARGYRAVVVMEYIFTAGSDDSSISISMPGEAVDYGDKSTSKAVQMAYKYALTQVLQVGSGDDPDVQSVDVGHAPSHAVTGPGRKRQNATTSPETPPEPQNGEPDLAAKQWSARLKLNLVEAYDGDKEEARTMWVGILKEHGYGADDFVKPEDRETIEQDVAIALLPVEQAPFL